MDGELAGRLVVRLLALRAKYGDDAEPPFREGVVIGFELAALAARQRGNELFAYELDTAAAMLRQKGKL